MSVAPPRPDDDDQKLVAALRRGEADAFERLVERHRRAIRAVTVRVVDDRRGGTLEEVPACVDVSCRMLAEGLLETYEQTSTFRCFLASFIRSKLTTYLQDVTPPATHIAALPSTASIFLDEVLAEEPAIRAGGVVDRMQPNMGGFLRLRLRGLDREDIGRCLGLPAETVRGHLERLGERLGELDDEEPAYAETAWRMVLDAAPIDERVATARRTLRDARFRQKRSVVESTFRALRSRELLKLHPKSAECLDEEGTAAFVDGSSRGPDRTRAEGHIGTCPRCIDAVAALTMDIRTIGALRPVIDWDADFAVAAACIATGSYRAGERLLEATGRTDGRTRALTRLARIGQSLVDGVQAIVSEPSRVVPTNVPSDADAPLVALEALINDDTHTADRAIDDELARGTLGARLRLVSLAADHRSTGGRGLAEELLGKSPSDPGLVADARATLSLPAGNALPREIVVERVRDMIPATLKYLTREL